MSSQSTLQPKAGTSKLKIRVISDAHLEYQRYLVPELWGSEGEDVVVLAGDTNINTLGLDWALKVFPYRQIVYILGNHEYYEQEFDTFAAKCRALTEGTRLHVLQDNFVDIGGARFMGSTLWTNYRRFGELQREVMNEWANVNFTDIHFTNKDPKFLTTEHASKAFETSVAWLDREIARSPLPVVVVTHHAPTRATENPEMKGYPDKLTHYNDLNHLIRAPVKLWIHGHTHYSCDALVNNIPVVSNQKGFPQDMATFDWRKCYEIDLN